MKLTKHTLARFLTYSGTLPFILGSLALGFFEHHEITRYIITCYGAIIISFICGIHWAIYLYFSEKNINNLFITSNALALLAWLSLLLANNFAVTILQISCFLSLFMLDYKLFNNEILPDWFYKIRKNATIIVSVNLTIIAFYDKILY